MKIEYISDTNSITETERSSIENSIGTIASTPYGAAPFIRNMGIREYPLKDDSVMSANKYATEVITQCGIWEDRAQVRQVVFDGTDEVRMVIEHGKR